ncbi:histone-like nucleoid-structuring protein Lsr2 [Streptomyces heliomycini]|uniref:Histone-like nucleoid-structuring protein Lsr2 n=1 Tax=Streptomyces heliomycini TaxID=284032 RepID=A0ABV5L1V2_9ACTN
MTAQAEEWNGAGPVPIYRKAARMRRTVLVPVEKILCDGCARKGVETDAAEVLSISGGSSWDLCAEHAERFRTALMEALGTPEPEGPAKAATVLAVVAEEPAEIPAGEDEHQDHEEPTPAQAEEAEEGKPAQAEPQSSVTVAGVPHGYDVESYRLALKGLGYRVVGTPDRTTVALIIGENGANNRHKVEAAQARKLPCLDSSKNPKAFANAVKSGDLLAACVDSIPAPATPAKKRGLNEEIRAWAKAAGYPVSSRGRIATTIKEAFVRAQEADAGEVLAA